RRNSTERVNTAESKVVSAVKGNGVTAVKASTGCVWRPRVNAIYQISKDNRWICTHGHPQQALKNKDIVDSGCSRHMIGNKAYLADYQEINDGYFVTFGSSRAVRARWWAPYAAAAVAAPPEVGLGWSFTAMARGGIYGLSLNVAAEKAKECSKGMMEWLKKYERRVGSKKGHMVRVNGYGGKRLVRKNKLKARGTLLMSLPDKHQLKFNNHKDAKTLMEVKEKRFSGNTETKKVQKTLLKQQYENFTGSSSESLDQIHDRLQNLISQLEILGVSLSQEDINLKFFRSLPNEWRTHTLIWKNKKDLKEQSLDDLFNSLKIYDAEVKSSSSVSTSIQNIAFVSSSNTDNTNEPVSAAASVFAVSAKIPVSAIPNVDSLSNVVIYSFFARQSNSLQLDNDDLKQIDDDDLKEMDLKWKGHFARECRSTKDTRRNGVAEPQRRSVPVETSTSNALVSQCLESVEARLLVYQQNEYVFKEDIKLLQFEVQLRDNALVVLRPNLEKAEQERDDFKLKLEKFQTSSKNLSNGYHVVPPPYTGTFMLPKPDLVFYNAPNDVKTVHPAFNVELSPTKPDNNLSHTHRPSAPIIEDWVSDSEDDYETKPSQNTTIPKPTSNGTRRNRKACFVCKSLDHLIKDYDIMKRKWLKLLQGTMHQGDILSNQRHVVPTAVVPKSQLVHINAARPITTDVPKINVTRPRQDKPVVTKTNSPPKRLINRSPSPKASTFPPKVTAVKAPMVNAAKGNTQNALKDKGVIDSGCSRHMIGNMSYLSNFKELNGGYVAFGGNPKGGKISKKGKTRTGKLDFDDVYFVEKLKFNLFSVSQICDKKNSVLSTDTECLVLSLEFKLPDENQVLLRFPRENNMYNVDLKNIVPSGDLTCLFAKATLDESNLWHRRLGHINLKTMNKLVKGNLVRGLPSNVFENDHTCVACKKGKQHRASCKTKPVSSVNQPLQRLHMDLFRPTFVKILNNKSYCLVVTDDYSRFTLVFFLATKDETSLILKTFIIGLETQLSLKVKIIRSNNGTEFMNQDLNQFYRIKGIKREFSVPRTPQQNGIAERKNRTLIEAARTMLADSLLPIPFWAEAVNTAFYVQNRFLVTKRHNKTPYELLHGRTPSISFMRPFGCLVTILNTLDSLGKFNGKVDEEFLVGYSISSKAFRNTDRDDAFDEKEPEFEGRKPESEVNISLSSSAHSKKHDDKTKREAKGKIPVESLIGYKNLSAEFEDFFDNSINEDNADGTLVLAVGQISTNSTNTFSAAGPSNAAVSPTHGNLQADFKILETSITVSPILTTRVHKDHHVTQIIGDLSSATQPRSMTRVAKDQGKKDERGIVVRNKARLVAQGHTQEEDIDYEEVFALVARIEAIRFEVPDYPDKVYKVVKALYGLHQAPRACSIKYALTVNPNIYVSCIKQFWTTVAVKKVNGITRLHALADKKRVIITEATIRDALHLDDAEGVECLPNEEIFAELARMGYEKPSTKLTFYKAFFSSRKFNFSKYIFDSLVRNVDSSTKFYMYPRFLQLIIRAQVGDLSSHTTKYSSLALTHKVFENIRKVGKGFSRVDTPLFEGMIVEQPVGEGADEVHDEGVSTAGVAAEGDVSAADDVVPAVVEEPSIPSPTPPTLPPQPSQDRPSTSQDTIAQALEINKLKQRVKKLERRNKASKLKRLKKIGSAQRVDTSDDTVMDDVSKQRRMIADMDADVDVTLKDVATIDLEHADKDLSMQDDEIEPTELKEVVEVVTTAKLITEVVTAASAIITAAAPQLTTVDALTLTTAPSAARRRKGVVIRDPEETATPSTIIYSEAKSKDKGKGILTKEQMDEEYSRALKRLSESQDDKASKKQKLDEEVAELKRHLQIVPNDGDDVYTEATSLARKVPVVDYEIYNEENKPYYKSKELMPDIQAQIWKNQRSVHGQAKVKSWKLLQGEYAKCLMLLVKELVLPSQIDVVEDGTENLTVEQVRKRAKWDNDDYVCRGLILNGMSDFLFDIYQNVETSKELWYTLEAKYMAEDASSMKFLVSNFTNYKMTDSRPVLEQYNELLGILESFSQHKMNMDESIQSSAYYKFLEVHDSDKPKGNNVAGLIIVNMVEHNNSSRYNDNKGKHKHHDTRANPNKKPKVTCWKCGKPGHLKKDCKAGNGDDVAWWGDSGATMHVSKDRCWFKTYESLNNGSILHMRNELTTLVYGRGCVVLRAAVMVPDQKMKILGERGIECIFVGYAEHSNTFRFYVIKPNDLVAINSIIKSRDVIFYEHKFSFVPRPSQRSLVQGTKDSGGSVVSERVTDEIVQQSEPQLRKSKRHKTPKYFRPEFQLYLIEGIRDLISDQHPYCFNVEDDPKTFDESMKSQDGFKQKSGINYFDTYAPMARISTIRLLIAMESIHNMIIHQMDVKIAFLNGELEEEVYMNKPLVFIMSGNENKVDLTKEFLSSRFSIKDRGEADVIFGIRIKHESNGIAISQSYYIEKVLKKFNYSDRTPVSTPLDTCEKLMPNRGLAVSQLEYSRVIGYLILVYYGYPSVLEGYTDASWIRNTKDNSSTSGWVFLLGGGAISWASKKQTCITGSTMEYEFVALAATGKEAEWLKNLLFKIPLWVKPIAPISIRCDSAATLAKAYSQMYNRKSRHLGVRHSMIVS
nr:putative ribonuclease H-like domain-containing protein [Tanacetum cinerariifolium]